MSSSDPKKNFDWQKGKSLDNQDYTHIAEVRKPGQPKLKKALHADPAIRKEERDKIIMGKQSLPYKTPAPKDDGSIVIEESQSGLSEQVEDSKIKKIIDRSNKIRGLDRFGKKK